MPIQFTEDELRRLRDAARKGAQAIVEAWDTLNDVSARIKRDWEPVETSVADILDTFASGLDAPTLAATENITTQDVAEAFGDEQHWENEKGC